MKQFAILGLGAFGQRMLDELLGITSEIIIIDKDREIIEKYTDMAKAAYIADVINETALTKIIPPEIDAVIVDLGGKLESSIMAISYLKKMGIKTIIAKAQSDEQGQVLTLVGATRVIFPDLEAAKRITPMLASSLLFNFMPISPKLALAEIRANEACIGKSIRDANLRQLFGLNILALRKENDDDFVFINNPSYVFMEDDILLVAGEEENLLNFSRQLKELPQPHSAGLFRNLFSSHTKKPV
ncbi:TrkA family potassium uptake protein [Brucepastera parasyntrophica]|uniref:potassium channel family protein n=1 Tax=Brucepastera parasyntrophica TaxID=2880008 RepID=UPI002109F3B0|nr:TrkA family potassium uptake protein [Brucepastera parasyntrophica]ULQ59362.1 TrkA family potassium uptake protein [Brucepastera parasyntrophica]